MRGYKWMGRSPINPIATSSKYYLGITGNNRPLYRMFRRTNDTYN